MIRENAKGMRLLAMLAGVALAVSACGGGGGSSMAPPSQPDPVDLSMVTPGHMALPAGTIEIVAGMSMDHGDVTFMCAPDDGNCTVMVAADGTVTSTGGTVTAMDSPAYTMRLAADGQRTAASNAIMAAKTAADALSTVSTDEEIAAAEALIATAKTAVMNATALSMADVATLNSRIAAVEDDRLGCQDGDRRWARRRHAGRHGHWPRQHAGGRRRQRGWQPASLHDRCRHGDHHGTRYR